MQRHASILIPTLEDSVCHATRALYCTMLLVHRCSKHLRCGHAAAVEDTVLVFGHVPP